MDTRDLDPDGPDQVADPDRANQATEEEGASTPRSVTRRQFVATVAIATGGAAVGACTSGSMGALGEDAGSADGATGDAGGADGGTGGIDAAVGDPDAGVGSPDGGPGVDASTPPANHIYVARGGTPVDNVRNAVALAGGIERYVNADDVVVLNPNGQWPKQGYTNTESMKALIDVILERPGGFTGEIIVTEHVQRDPAGTMLDQYCWNMAPGGNRTNNWPDMNYFELMADYHARGVPNVTANPLYDSSSSSGFRAVSGPADLAAGEQGWVRTTFTAPSNGRVCRLSHPILRSSHTDRLIDLKDGVWDGGYTGQRVRVIFLPTLNNHGHHLTEDYAGVTSAVKCHLGIVEFDGTTGYTMHRVGFEDGHPEAVGESVGHLITTILSPTFYLTCAEYTGHMGRTDNRAAHTRTVGLCADPVSLDYWMCKYVMLPADPMQTFMNPDGDNNTRRQLEGCHSRGVGTLVESEMVVDVMG